MTFKELGLSQNILESLEEMGHVTPTPIQELAIPHILQKKDVLGCAQTGTGKTAAFVLPIIQSLLMAERNRFFDIKVLVLSPTRELAIQTRDNFRKYASHTNFTCDVVLGGVNQRSQERTLKKGVDILVATPGRLLDLVKQRIVKLNAISVLVLDEADTMLDMGFIHDIKDIISRVPEDRQTLMFSATMPSSIRNLANEFLKDPVVVEANKTSLTIDKINQSVYFVDTKNKSKLLLEILSSEDDKSTIIFTRTKHGANRLTLMLENNDVFPEVIHGNKTQGARVKALNNFKSGRSKILIATDIAARGIDVSELGQVINYDIPNIAESYIHRIGRTGRAGLGGIAISFCDHTERKHLANIERLMKQTINIVEDHNFPSSTIVVREVNNYPKKNNKWNNSKPTDRNNKWNNSKPSTENGNKDNRNRDNYRSRNDSANKWNNPKPSTENGNKDNRNRDNYRSRNDSTNKWNNSKPSTENGNKDNRNRDNYRSRNDSTNKWNNPKPSTENGNKKWDNSNKDNRSNDTYRKTTDNNSNKDNKWSRPKKDNNRWNNSKPTNNNGDNRNSTFKKNNYSNRTSYKK